MVDVRPGDKLMMRCTFDSTKRNRTTFIGATHADEMCNFYIMYYYDTTMYGQIPSFPCVNNRFISYQLDRMPYPEDSNSPSMKDQSRINDYSTSVNSDINEGLVNEPTLDDL